MAKGNKIIVNFYRISPVFIGEDTYDEAVDRMKSTINASKERYIEQVLSIDDFGDFSIRIFYGSAKRKPRWSDFISDILSEESPMKKAMGLSHSFIMFIGYKDNIFAITGGTGCFAIENFISYTFGIDIITRLIEKNSPVIKSLQDRGLTGPVFGQTKHFRNERRLSDENQFGQIYKEVKAELSKKKLSSVFEFKKSELKRDSSGCLAKHSFTINKSINFDSFLKVIKNLSDLLDKPANFDINSVAHIERKKEKELFSKLQAELARSLYDNYSKEEKSDFDFSHREFDKYAHAASIHILTNDKPIILNFHPNLKDIEDKLRRKVGNEIKNEFDYKHFILYSEIQSLSEEGELLTKGKVIDHLHGEMTYLGISYFLIDGEWYLIRPNFIEELNKELKYQIDSYWDDSLLTIPFDSVRDEREFNEAYIGQPQTFVFDTILSDGVEACDILKYNEDSVFLVHVKKKFDNSIRDLSIQIITAARRLQHDIKTNYSFVQKLQNLTEQGKNSESEFKRKLAGQIFPGEGLPELFKSKKTCFCFAFVDIAAIDRSLKDDIQLFRSNVAKISLSSLIKEITSLGFNFKIIQIKKKAAQEDGIDNKAA